MSWKVCYSPSGKVLWRTWTTGGELTEGRSGQRSERKKGDYPLSPMRTPRKKPTVRRLKRLVCGVCGDGASGVHYGVATCEGCRCFFKRIVRAEQITPGSKVCKTGGNCPISRDNRKGCRYCRFRKCCRRGMQADMVVGNSITRSVADAIREAGGDINDDQEEEQDLNVVTSSLLNTFS